MRLQHDVRCVRAAYAAMNRCGASSSRAGAARVRAVVSQLGDCRCRAHRTRMRPGLRHDQNTRSVRILTDIVRLSSENHRMSVTKCRVRTVGDTSLAKLFSPRMVRSQRRPVTLGRVAHRVHEAHAVSAYHLDVAGRPRQRLAPSSGAFERWPRAGATRATRLNYRSAICRPR